MQYTYATSAYHEARFLVHFHLAILANFERGSLEFFLMNESCNLLTTLFQGPGKNYITRHLALHNKYERNGWRGPTFIPSLPYWSFSRDKTLRKTFIVWPQT